MQALIEYLAKEGRAILQAPTIFALTLALSASIIWAIINWAYASKFEGQASTLTSLEGRLKLKDDQIADYKDKLSGATPSEAKARMDALETQIKALTPRRITENDKSKIRQALDGIKANVDITQDISASDAKPLAADLASAFQSAGWGVNLPMMMGISNPPPTGVALRVVNPNALRTAEQAVAIALKAAHVAFDLQGGKSAPLRINNLVPEALASKMPPEADVELLVTTQAK